jgi:hypothetical protein
MITVKQIVEVYEENGETVPIGLTKTIGVDSHWNHNEWVVLVIDRRRLTVKGSDLEAAITNAMHSNRF